MFRQTEETKMMNAGQSISETPKSPAGFLFEKVPPPSLQEHLARQD